MKRKLVQIRSCVECPHGKETEDSSGFFTFWCHKLQQEIYHKTACRGFHKACPLPEEQQ